MATLYIMSNLHKKCPIWGQSSSWFAHSDMPASRGNQSWGIRPKFGHKQEITSSVIRIFVKHWVAKICVYISNCCYVRMFTLATPADNPVNSHHTSDRRHLSRDSPFTARVTWPTDLLLTQPGETTTVVNYVTSKPEAWLKDTFTSAHCVESVCVRVATHDL